jgi:hypothetical protein
VRGDKEIGAVRLPKDVMDKIVADARGTYRGWVQRRAIDEARAVLNSTVLAPSVKAAIAAERLRVAYDRLEAMQSGH